MNDKQQYKTPSSQVINFSAGPAKIPEPVMEKAKSEFLSYNQQGYSIMETSHRSADFLQITIQAKDSIRRLLEVPKNYEILLMQGGATAQFAAVPLNLIAREEGRSADYVITGSWSAKAAKEAEKYCEVKKVLPSGSKAFVGIASEDSWELNFEAAYLYYCDNETIHGVEFNFIPSNSKVPLVCDMSSNLFSRKFDISRFAVVFGCAQKNAGCSGVTIVIVRNDILSSSPASATCPSILDYKQMADAGSLLNTPSTYSVYMLSLVLDWLLCKGGVPAIELENSDKASSLYQCIDNSEGFYVCPVWPEYRSRMNAPFRIENGNEELETKFLKEALNQGLHGLKGHRSVGGIRVSMYNALRQDEVDVLIEFMLAFSLQNRTKVKVI